LCFEGGLQVNHQGKWIDIPVIPDTFVVNIGVCIASLRRHARVCSATERWKWNRCSLWLFAGDYLSLLTGGRFISPLHRVVTGEEER
jgi:isopenicillin N synthase-like dioxygenase